MPSKTSVVIPTFNRREWLAHALASVISQTVRAHEIIIVDDGSTDGTSEILDEFVRQHPDMRILVVRQDNRGPSSARNAGMKLASGDFIAFLDDDDIWLPKKMERQLAALEAEPTIALLGSATDTLKLFGGSRLFRIREWNLLYRNYFLTPSVIARKDAILKSGGFPEDMRHCEDYALWMKIASKHKCAFLNEVLVSCGHGKPSFGHSGLSGDLDALYAGERAALRCWYIFREGGVPSFILAQAIAGMRHIKRRLTSKWLRPR